MNLHGLCFKKAYTFVIMFSDEMLTLAQTDNITEIKVIFII